VNTFKVRWIIAAASLGAAASAVQADSVCYVDDDALGGGDGASWATAYRFLQDALASLGDPQGGVTEVRVAGGVYLPDRYDGVPDGTGSRQASFELTGDVVLRGGYLGLAAGPGESPDQRDPLGHPSILSGDLAGDDGPDFAGNLENSYHVVAVGDGAVAPTLAGFTVAAGNADGSTPYDHGGGVYNLAGDPLFSGCTFTGNAAGEGGAMFNAPTTLSTATRRPVGAGPCATARATPPSPAASSWATPRSRGAVCTTRAPTARSCSAASSRATLPAVAAARCSASPPRTPTW
jgi:hypothetical protein